MSLERGAVSVRRLVLDAEVELPSKLETFALIRRALEAHAFSGRFSGSSAVSEGWVRPDQPESVDFGAIDAWQVGNEVAWLCLRTDERKVQASLLRAKLEARLAKWKADHLVERVPRSVQAQIKEEVTEELLAKAQPKMRLLPMAIDLERRQVLVAATSDKKIEEVKRLFGRQLGWKFETDSPYRWTPRSDDLVDRLDAPSDQLASAFLLWLWHGCAAGTPMARSVSVEIEEQTREVTWELGEQIELRKGDGERWAGSRAPGLDEHAVVLLAVGEGYLPSALDVTLGIEDWQYVFRLSAPHGQPSKVRGLSGPEQGSTDHPLAEAVWLRTGELGRLYEALEGLFARFAIDVESGKFRVSDVQMRARRLVEEGA